MLTTSLIVYSHNLNINTVWERTFSRWPFSLERAPRSLTTMVKLQIPNMDYFWHNTDEASHWPTPSIMLTHWGRVMHIYDGKLTIIGSDNGLSPGRRQAIINASILSIGRFGISFSKFNRNVNIFIQENAFEYVLWKMAASFSRLQRASCQICKIGVAPAPGMSGTFSPSPRLSDPDMQHGTYERDVMHGGIANLWFLLKWMAGKHTRCMRNPLFCVSGKRPMC